MIKNHRPIIRQNFLKTKKTPISPTLNLIFIKLEVGRRLFLPPRLSCCLWTLRQHCLLRQIETDAVIPLPRVVGGEEFGTSVSAQVSRPAVHSDPRTFADAHHHSIPVLRKREELLDALIARLAHVLGVRIRIDVVRVDLERYQVKRAEALIRVHDRHVVGRADRRTRQVRARARTEVRHAFVHALLQSTDEIETLHVGEHAEGVPTSDEDSLGILQYVVGRQTTLVNADDLDTHPIESLPDDLQIGVPVGQSIRDEHETSR